MRMWHRVMKKIGVVYFKMLEKNEENHNTSHPIAGLLGKT